MSHTHIAAQTPRLLSVWCLRCDGGTSESRNRTKESRIRALHARPPMLPSLSVFNNATSSHRNLCTTYGEICSTEKRVCLFKRNVKNVQTTDTERTRLTSQIFAVVDFAKHRPGMRPCTCNTAATFGSTRMDRCLHRVRRSWNR